MKPFRCKSFAAMGSVLCCTLLATTARSQDADPQEPVITAAKEASPALSQSKDETNASPRERGRILVKLNPIASEYQIFGDLGTSPGGDADGEGVDYRSFFPRSNPVNSTKDSLQVGYTLNYNNLSGSSKSGYSLSGVKALDKQQSWVIAAQIQNSASDRLIEHYESVWQLAKEQDGYLLDRPRLSFDRIDTQNTTAALQIGHKLNDRNSFYFKTQYQDYTDNSYRNRLELQFGRANRVSGSQSIDSDGNIDAAVFEEARSRRYYGDTDNNRTRQHYTFGGTHTGEEWTIDYSVYSHKWNLDTLWRDWNFTESGLNLGYSIEDPYKPSFQEYGDTDLLDITQAHFSSLRLHSTFTRDRDLASRIDAERKVFLGGRETWIQTGLLHREKERDSWQSRKVLLPSDNAKFTLAKVAYDNPKGTPLLSGTYQLPAGLDPTLSRDFIENSPEYFALDDFKSKTEAAPQTYSAKEAVSSAYLLGTQEIGELTIEFGGRFEHTKTNTRGTVVIPEAVNDPNEGIILETIEDPDNGSLIIIKDLYAENSYNNFIPSAEASFRATPETTFKAAWFQLLMRPQYYNIVDYRRINIPTRTISEGNPNLNPTSIDKFRLSWSKENKTLGSLSAEAYFINIKDFFYGSTSTEPILEDGTPTQYRVSRVENGESASIKGIEIQWTKKVSEWGIFNSASTSMAYTFSDSSAAVDSRPNDILPTPERSDHLFKFNASGTIGKFSSSIDASYQSEALDDLGSSYDQDGYREPVISLSLTNKYRFNEKTSISLMLANLNNHPERSYEGSELRVTGNQYSSWFANFGLTRSF